MSHEINWLKGNGIVLRIVHNAEKIDRGLLQRDFHIRATPVLSGALLWVNRFPDAFRCIQAALTVHVFLYFSWMALMWAPTVGRTHKNIRVTWAYLEAWYAAPFWCTYVDRISSLLSIHLCAKHKRLLSIHSEILRTLINCQTVNPFNGIDTRVDSQTASLFLLLSRKY